MLPEAGAERGADAELKLRILVPLRAFAAEFHHEKGGGGPWLGGRFPGTLCPGMCIGGSRQVLVQAEQECRNLCLKEE